MTEKAVYYTVDTKMVDVLKSDFHVVLLFKFFGVKLGFGNTETMGDICDKYHLNPLLFVFVCNTYRFDDYRLSPREVEKFPVDDAMAYILKVHEHYARETKSDIKREFSEVKPMVDLMHRNEIVDLFNGFLNLVEEHTLYVERVFSLYEEIDAHAVKIMAAQQREIDYQLEMLIDSICRSAIPFEYADKYNHFLYFIALLKGRFRKHHKVKEQIFAKMLNGM